MPTEPATPSLAEAARRAVDVCEPGATNDAIAEFERRLEDRDEPGRPPEQVSEWLAEQGVEL
jgi:hypothetical protein